MRECDLFFQDLSSLRCNRSRWSMWNGIVMRDSIKFACFCGLIVSSMGCEQQRMAPPAAGEHPTVVVTQPLEKELADFAELADRQGQRLSELLSSRRPVQNFSHHFHLKKNP